MKAARNLGRLELLAWVNDAVASDYPKVEMCSDAIAYCQILDALHPTANVPLHRLNLSAKNKDDFARNLKVLDDVLSKLKGSTSSKRVDVEQISKGKFQFNMEFL